MTDVTNGALREYGSTPPARELTVSNWPEAVPWLEANYPAWRKCAAVIDEAAPGLAGEEYVAVTLFLAITRNPADQRQQGRFMAGFLLLRARTTGGGTERYGGDQALLDVMSAVLEEQLAGSPPAGGRDQATPMDAAQALAVLHGIPGSRLESNMAVLSEAALAGQAAGPGGYLVVCHDASAASPEFSIRKPGGEWL